MFNDDNVFIYIVCSSIAKLFTLLHVGNHLSITDLGLCSVVVSMNKQTNYLGLTRLFKYYIDLSHELLLHLLQFRVSHYRLLVTLSRMNLLFSNGCLQQTQMVIWSATS